MVAGGGEDDPPLGGDVLDPVVSCAHGQLADWGPLGSLLLGGDVHSAVLPLDGGGHGGHLAHPATADDEDVLPFPVSSAPVTCSSLDDEAVVLLLLVKGPVVVPGGKGMETKLFFLLIIYFKRA